MYSADSCLILLLGIEVWDVGHSPGFSYEKDLGLGVTFSCAHATKRKMVQSYGSDEKEVFL